MRGKLIVFSVADELYALPVRLVREIVPIAKLSRPPGTPDIVAGYLVLDGHPVRVIRLAVALGEPATPIALYTPLVLLEVDGYPPSALLVEQVREIVTVDERAILPLEAGQGDEALVTGVLRHGELQIHLLAVAPLLERVRAGDAVMTASPETTR